MKSYKKAIILILAILGIKLTLPTFIYINTNIFTKNVEYTNSPNEIIKFAKVSGKIHISNNWSETNIAGICTGSGSFSDPYVIEDLIIDARGSGSGILIESSSVFFIIENCTIINSRTGEPPSYGAGINLYGVGNGTVKNNNISFNDIGILINGINNSISQNQVFNNLGGIYLGDYGFNEIFENNISHNIIGFWGLFFEGGNFSFNHVRENQQYGVILYYSWNSSIIGNSIISNNGTGLLLLEGMYANISKNRIINNSNYGILLKFNLPWSGDPIPNPSFTYISENVVSKNAYGIMLNLTEETSIHNNTINQNEYTGIKLHFSNYNNITDNRLKNNKLNGIHLNYSKFNIISGNKISGNYKGINLNESDLNEIIQNTIKNNYFGIYLTTSHKNDIINNTLHYNGVCIFETDDCIRNYYENNDCIETGDNGGLMLPILITVSTSFVGLTIIIILYRRHRRKQDLYKKSVLKNVR